MSRISVYLFSLVLLSCSGCAMAAAYPMTTAMGIDIGVSTILGQLAGQQNPPVAQAKLPKAPRYKHAVKAKSRRY